eukprot:4411857-Karenia_brevis.AAC.1
MAGQDVVVGKSALVQLDKEVMRVEKVSADAVDTWVAERRSQILKALTSAEADIEEGSIDARTLAVRVDKSGQRHRSFEDATDLLDPQEFTDWPYEPPRTVQYVCKEV